jgi:hypothetical protein
MDGIDFSTLLSYHKQEASEELTYLAIIYTAILGILGYIGSASRIEPQVRIGISIIFSIFLYTFMLAVVSSMAIHDALHEEIRNYVLLHPDQFINGQKSNLYLTLTRELQPHHSFSIVLMGIGLGLMVVLGLLTIGNGKVFSLQNLIKSKRI